MLKSLVTTLAVAVIVAAAGPTMRAQPPWSFRGLQVGMTRAHLDSITVATGSPWISGGPFVDRRTGIEHPTILSAGRMRISGVFCFDSFAVVLRHHDDRRSFCAFFTSITLNYTDDVLTGFRVDLDVEGTVATDTLVRFLVEEFSSELSTPILTRREDGGVDYSGEIVDNTRTYARWERDGVDVRLIDTRPSLALRVRRVER